MLHFDKRAGFLNLENVPRAKRVGMLIPLALLDTAVLGWRVLKTRFKLAGLSGLLRTRFPRDVPILYLDVGLHKEGKQARLLNRWTGRSPALRNIGFEANPEHFDHFNTRHATAAAVEAVNVALVGPDYAGETVTLYLDGKAGLGDTLMQSEGAQGIDVPAIQLSRWLAERGIDPRKSVTLIRMNIEGAELGVIRDLVDSGLASSIDGYFGTWIDVAKKAGPEAEREFEAMIEEQGIESYSFNDVDSRIPFRDRIVRYHVLTRILSGMRAKGITPNRTVRA